MSKEFIENIHYKGGNFTENPFKMTEYENCTFSNCIFYEANLSDAQFTDCIFDNCDLSMAKLYQTAFKEVKFINCKADFRASYNFSIDPELNPIFKAKFSSQTIGGLLNKYKIVIE